MYILLRDCEGRDIHTFYIDEEKEDELPEDAILYKIKVHLRRYSGSEGTFNDPHIYNQVNLFVLYDNDVSLNSTK